MKRRDEEMGDEKREDLVLRAVRATMERFGLDPDIVHARHSPGVTAFVDAEGIADLVLRDSYEGHTYSLPERLRERVAPLLIHEAHPREGYTEAPSGWDLALPGENPLRETETERPMPNEEAAFAAARAVNEYRLKVAEALGLTAEAAR